ncbi:MAG: tRNA lysidine(34) synthetase TilS [Fibrobacter sp.]|uniref:tRNA lysidine(34) synthetase n=1 Tax=Fibrobacter sp. TaxID=35828 RepID=UPI0025C00DDF|nr:tRNA lysidine(34) synthetase [Fibrobacter sp.]MBQ7080777.1 tRNA lysidine(34) synthetase TilS [Fibrobacter sp.]
MSFDIAEKIRRHGFKRLLFAVSGGLDSICLAHYFIENREALGIEWLGIAHVHHGLRVGTADRDAAFVEAFAKSHGVPFFLKRLDGKALKAAEGSLEENARDARYKALVEIVDEIGDSRLRGNDKNNGDSGTEAGMTSANKNRMDPPSEDDKSSDPIPHSSIAIVTAHHANDQAETMFMRLKRGTTLAGLRGIQEFRALSRGVAGLASEAPLEGVAYAACGRSEGDASPTPHTPYLYRPFLNVTRTELLEYTRKNKLTWCEDESNADVKFARNKIRHEFLPNLECECPGAIKQLCRIAELADKAYEKVTRKCDILFATCLNKRMDSLPLVENDALQDGNAHSSYLKESEATDLTPHTTISLDKKKLNKVLRAHADADLSEMFRLWLSEKGFRFPIGFFYGPKEPAHVKIPVHAVYRRRSIVKIRHTVWICEFEDALSAAKFVSCEKK